MDQSNEQVGSASESASFESKPMSMLATLAICSGGWLVPGLGHILIGRWLRGVIFAACVLVMFGLGTMTWPSYDYGTTFLWVCGLLNYLIVLDAFDIAQGRKP